MCPILIYWYWYWIKTMLVSKLTGKNSLIITAAPIQSEMVHCVWNRNTTLVLWIYYVVLNGSHHVAAATWRESKNFFPRFSFSSPSSLHVSCTAAATGMRTMEKREEEHMIIFPFYCCPPVAVSKQTLLLFFLLISCDQFTRAALKTFFRGTSQCVSVAQPSFCFKNFLKIHAIWLITKSHITTLDGSYFATNLPCFHDDRPFKLLAAA